MGHIEKDFHVSILKRYFLKTVKRYRKILDFDRKISTLWQEEKRASVESIHILREEALAFLASDRERIMRLSKEDAIKEVLKTSKIGNKIMPVNTITTIVLNINFIFL